MKRKTDALFDLVRPDRPPEVRHKRRCIRHQDAAQRRNRTEFLTIT